MKLGMSSLAPQDGPWSVNGDLLVLSPDTPVPLLQSTNQAM